MHGTGFSSRRESTQQRPAATEDKAGMNAHEAEHDHGGK